MLDSSVSPHALHYITLLIILSPAERSDFSALVVVIDY